MNDYYILDNRTPVSCDLMTWAPWFENFENRRVAKTLIGKTKVSTVFLGLDHSFGSGEPPILFETMAFDLPGGDEWLERCATWEEAEAQHAAMVQRATALIESSPTASGSDADARSDDK